MHAENQSKTSAQGGFPAQISQAVDPTTLGMANQSLFSEMSGRVICDICGASLKNKWNLKVHKEVHAEPHSCKICNLKFQFKHKLRAHMGRHTGKISYQCQACPAIFGYKRSLLLHIQKDHEKIMHYCSGCGAHFNQKYNLDKHTKICRNFRDHDEVQIIAQVEHSRKEASKHLILQMCHNIKTKRRNKRKRKSKSREIRNGVGPNKSKNSSNTHQNNVEGLGQKEMISSANHCKTSSEDCVVLLNFKSSLSREANSLGIDETCVSDITNKHILEKKAKQLPVGREECLPLGLSQKKGKKKNRNVKNVLQMKPHPKNNTYKNTSDDSYETSVNMEPLLSRWSDTLSEQNHSPQYSTSNHQSTLRDKSDTSIDESYMCDSEDKAEDTAQKLPSSLGNSSLDDSTKSFESKISRGNTTSLVSSRDSQGSLCNEDSGITDPTYVAKATPKRKTKQSCQKRKTTQKGAKSEERSSIFKKRKTELNGKEVKIVQRWTTIFNMAKKCLKSMKKDGSISIDGSANHVKVEKTADVENVHSFKSNDYNPNHIGCNEEDTEAALLDMINWIEGQATESDRESIRSAINISVPALDIPQISPVQNAQKTAISEAITEQSSLHNMIVWIEREKAAFDDSDSVLSFFTENERQLLHSTNEQMHMEVEKPNHTTYGGSVQKSKNIVSCIHDIRTDIISEERKINTEKTLVHEETIIDRKETYGSASSPDNSAEMTLSEEMQIKLEPIVEL